MGHISNIKSWFLKWYPGPFLRAGTTQAKKSAKLGRMGCVCWLTSLKRAKISFWKSLFYITNMPHNLNQSKESLVQLFYWNQHCNDGWHIGENFIGKEKWFVIISLYLTSWLHEGNHMVCFILLFFGQTKKKGWRFWSL